MFGFVQVFIQEVDWWSLGILLFDMLTGAPPWTDKNEKTLCDMITTAKLVLPVFLSDDCKSLLKVWQPFLFCSVFLIYL